MAVGANSWVVVPGRGRVRIDKIQVGDQVLTDKGKFAPVIAMDESVCDAFEIETREGRRLVLSTDQLIASRHHEWSSKAVDTPPWSWLTADDGSMQDRVFGGNDVLLIRSPTSEAFNDPDKERMRAKAYNLMVAALTLCFGEKTDEGEWILHRWDERWEEVINLAGVRWHKDGRGELRFIYNVPYLNDTPIDGCALPRVLFTMEPTRLDWFLDVLLMYHGWMWPWEAGHYLRASSFMSASHLQHLLLRAGWGTGIDEGNRWIVGEGPVWRVQTRNPVDHKASRTRRVAPDGEPTDHVRRVYLRGQRRCISLTLKPIKGHEGYSVNDMGVFGEVDASNPQRETHCKRRTE